MVKKQLIFFMAHVLIGCNAISQQKRSEEDKVYQIYKTDQEWKEELPKMSYMV